MSNRGKLWVQKWSKVMVLLCVVSCAKKKEDPATTADLSFATLLSSVLVPTCQAGCHSSSGEASSTSYILTGTAATDYATITGGSLIDTTTPANSLMLLKSTGQQSHDGGTAITLGSSQYTSILNWITQGAKNN